MTKTNTTLSDELLEYIDELSRKEAVCLKEEQIRLQRRIAEMEMMPVSRIEHTAVRATKLASRKDKIHKPAGHTWVNILQFVFAKRTFENIFLQHICDMRDEQHEAIIGGNVWHARWIVVRGNCAVAIMIGMLIPTSVVKYVSKIWPLAG